MPWIKGTKGDKIRGRDLGGEGRIRLGLEIRDQGRWGGGRGHTRHKLDSQTTEG